MHRNAWALILMGISAATAWPHYNMLLPNLPMVQKGDKVVFVYQFGHPFEHELFDAPLPARVEVTTPDGKTRDITKSLERFKKPGGDGKDVAAYRFNYTPEQRGDHWFVLATPPIWFEDREEFVQDRVQVILHVQTQKGWETAPGEQLRMYPLTRPYGLLPGVAFQAQVFSGARESAKPLIRNMIEIERYNEQKPKDIPPDELVTFKVRCAPAGVFTCTLTEPGWWCMTAQAPGVAEMRQRNGKEYPVRQRVTLWVHVDKKTP